MASRASSATIDPDVTLSSIVAAVSAEERYADPTRAEREVGGVGLAHLTIGDVTGAAGLLEPLGFTVAVGIDAATGRRVAMAVPETGKATKRRWGVYIIDLSAPLGLWVAVPHPRSDERCELLAAPVASCSRVDAGDGVCPSECGPRSRGSCAQQ